MATPLATEQVTIHSQERTWRVQIECALNADYVLQAFREVVKSVDGTVLSKTPVGEVTRTLSGAASDVVTLQSGKTLTVAEMAEALVRHIEAWRAADLIPAAPAEDEGDEEYVEEEQQP